MVYRAVQHLGASEDPELHVPFGPCEVSLSSAPRRRAWPPGSPKLPRAERPAVARPIAPCGSVLPGLPSLHACVIDREAAMVDFALTEEVTKIRDMTREFARQEMRPAGIALDRIQDPEEAYTGDTMRALLGRA